MSEKLPEVESYQLPEYWEGHSKDDGCQWRESSGGEWASFCQEMRADSYGRKTLKEFLGLVDKEPIRMLGKGELFDASQFSEGTIIKYEQEVFYLDDDKRRKFPSYSCREFWGVVCGYENKGQRKQIVMRYSTSPYMSTARSIFRGMQTNSSMRVGRVSHERIKNRNGVFESVARVNRLELFKFGSGVREKAKKGIRLSSIGSFFRKPHPKAV